MSRDNVLTIGKAYKKKLTKEAFAHFPPLIFLVLDTKVVRLGLFVATVIALIVFMVLHLYITV